VKSTFEDFLQSVQITYPESHVENSFTGLYHWLPNQSWRVENVKCFSIINGCKSWGCLSSYIHRNWHELSWFLALSSIVFLVISASQPMLIHFSIVWGLLDWQLSLFHYIAASEDYSYNVHCLPTQCSSFCVFKLFSLSNNFHPHVIRRMRCLFFSHL